MSTTQIDILGSLGRVAKWVMIFALLSLATLSCKSYNGDDIPTPPPIPKDGIADVLFEINLPQSTVPDTYALAKADEDQIKTIEVLLFKIDPNDLSKKEYTGKPYYCDNISTDLGGSENKRFTVSLPAGGAYDIVVLANSRDAVNDLLVVAPPTVTAKDDLLKLLKIDHATKWIADKNDLNYKPFPMWGELVNVNISANLKFQIQMTRMLAKINVTLNTETGATSSFKLKEVILTNAHAQGRIVPDEGNITGGRATKPTLVDGSTNTNTLHYTDATTADVGFVNVIYTFEAEKATESTLSTATFIIVKGLYVADNTDYYYKVDLGEKKGGIITYHHILRNFEYIIKINSIGGAGYLTLPEAIKGTSSNIESSLVVWDNNELPIVVWDNNNALGFSTDDITLGYKASVSKPLKVMTDYSSGWKIDKIEYVSGTDWLALSPMKSTVGEEISMEEIEFTVTENDGSVARVCWVYVSAGALSHKVKVTQIPILRIAKIVWNDYDGVNGVVTNDDGVTDVDLTNITVVDSEGTSYSSTSIGDGVITPTLVVRASIASIVVTYKGYALTLPADKYTHDASTNTLTVTDHSLIGKAIHLDRVRDDLAGSYIQVSDVNLLGYTNTAGDLNNWVPIGTKDIPFKGSYDGGSGSGGIGFKILNFKIDRVTKHVGLFSSIGTGSTLNKIHIASGGEIKASLYVSAICGSNYGEISGCTNAAEVSTDNSGELAGGICGDNHGTITGCKNEVTGNIKAMYYAGGICGSNYGIILDCANAAKVSADNESAGGISGSNLGTAVEITNCHNLGTAIINAGSNSGGICGDIVGGGTISGCTNAGTVNAESTGAGGICGSNNGSKITNCKNLVGSKIITTYSSGGICGSNYGEISGCTNAAEVSVSVDNQYAGGIVGYNSGTAAEITNCHNLGPAIINAGSNSGGICGHNNAGGTISGCTNAGTVNAKSTGAGGICGHNQYGTISACTNNGTVTGTVSGSEKGEKVGGISGRNYNGGKIYACVNTSTATISAVNWAGGIVGDNDIVNSEIKACYNLASVTVTTASGRVIGAIVGAGTYPTNCYFGGNAEANFGNTTGSTRFTDSGAWPNTSMPYWSEYHATNNPTGYWKSIGSWPSGGTPTYPQLNTTP